MIAVESTTTTIINEGLCSSECVYGEHSNKTNILRYYRDKVLKQIPEGHSPIKLHYRWNPAITKAMEEDEAFKEEVKVMINETLRLIRSVE